MPKSNHPPRQDSGENITLSTLHSMIKTINHSLGLDEVLSDSVNVIMALFHCKNVLIRLIDKQTNELVIASHKGLSADELAKFVQRRRIGTGLVSSSIETGEVFVIEDLDTDPRYGTRQGTARSIGSRSLVHMPLYGKSGLLGTVNMHYREPQNFSTDQIQLFTTIGYLLGTAIENSQLYELQKTSALEWSATFDAMSDGVSIHSKDHRILRANRQLCLMTGLSAGELVGRKCYEIFHGSDKPVDLCPAEKMKGTIKDEFSEFYEENFQRWFNIVCCPIMDENEQPKQVVHVIRDITQRKKNEETLRESEVKFRGIAEQSLVGMSISQDGVFKYVNQAYADIHGYSVEELLDNFPMINLAHPDDKQAIMNNLLRRNLGDLDARYAECMKLKKNGEIINTAIYSSVVTYNGKPASLAVIVDVTERKRAEEALRDSEEKYRSLVSTLDTLALVDRDCRFLFANENFLAGFGPMKDSVIGRRYNEFHNEINSKIFADAVKYVFETGNPYQDEWLGQKRGRWLLRSFSPVRNAHGNVNAVTIASKDISERKRTEERLLESEKAARRLAQETELIAEIGRIISSTLDIEEVYERFAEKVREAIPFDRIGIATVNRKENTRTLRYVKCAESFGSRIGEVLPLAGSLAEQIVHTKSSLLINSANREEMIRKSPGTLSLGLGVQSAMVIPLISKDEVIGSFAIHSLKIDAYSENDLHLAERMAFQIAGAIANAQLFLERKQLEAERIQLGERLYRAEKMEALGKLAGGVAHDLNNVLGVLSGYSELLMDMTPAGSTLREYASHILKSSARGAAIIQDLLTLARRGVVVSEVINLNGTISNFLKTPEFDRLKEYHSNMILKTDLDKDLLNIMGSPVHLEKTVMNLLSNAAEAIAGRGDVMIRTENRYLDKAVRGYDKVNEGEYVVLAVSDTGGGIPAADLDKIFEPFYTKKSMGRSGTGLGLAIVWGTVKDHKGYIDVQSIEGKGTTFTLYFPVTREKMGEDVQKIPAEKYMGHGESVLVVDDVEGQRQVASAILMRLGYKVNSVSSGEEAVEYLQSSKADLMVLDMIMEPGIDGLETYRRVLEINPHQKAIIVSGFSETGRARAAQELGAGAYVKKPYVMEKIGMAIRAELDRK